MKAQVAHLTTRDAVEAVAPAFRRCLTSPSAIRRLERTGELLPLTSGGGFELHLDNSDRADIAVRFLPGELASATSPLLECAKRLHASRRIPTGAEINYWLEFHLADDELPSPSIFAGPGNPVEGPPALPPRDDVWSELIHAVFEERRDDLLCCLRSYRRRLPAHAWIGYVGVMNSADRNSMRITVSGLKAREIVPYLRSVDWPGDFDSASAAARVAGSVPARPTLAVDIGARDTNKLGLELAPLNGGDSRELLTEAERQGLVRAEAVSRLLAWGGVTCRGDEHWPDELRGHAWGIVRRFNHLKLIFLDGAAPRTKAYLYYGLLPSEP